MKTKGANTCAKGKPWTPAVAQRKAKVLDPDLTPAGESTSAIVRPQKEKGLVLMSVLFVLLALLVLCAPFLSNARDASRQGAYSADVSQARLTLNSAAEAARARLGDSHPALDATPDGDSQEELLGTMEQVTAPGGDNVLWGISVEDESGRIDLNSASPQVLANVLGWQTRLAEVLSQEATEATVSGAGGLDPDGGVVIVNGEWIGYESIEQGQGGAKLVGLTRGLEAQLIEKEWRTWGPRPPSAHGFGSAMIDQRVYAIIDRRYLRGKQGNLYRYDVMEELVEVPTFARSKMEGVDWIERIESSHTTYVDQGTGARWQRAVRLLADITPQDTLELSPEYPFYFGPGTMVRISGEGRSEIRYVTNRAGNRIRVNRVLDNEYRFPNATIEALVRRPVNINTANPQVLEALFENLGMAGRSERISSREAVALVALVLEKRPFLHREDFLRRVVLPSAGLEPDPDAPLQDGDEEEKPLISPEDAEALYRNGLNANDALLAFGTMPFVFTSKDVYRMDLRASIQAENGLERVFQRKELVRRVVPQRPLLQLFHRQEDFERNVDLDREMPWWMTGPRSTNAYDGSQMPPSRAFVHLGIREGAVVIPGVTEQQSTGDKDAEQEPIQHVFADRNTDGWAQLLPARIPRTGNVPGEVQHFDYDTTDPEGRALGENPIAYDPQSQSLFWVPNAGARLLKPFALEFWMRLVGPAQGTIFDVLEGDPRTNRIHMAFGFEGVDLRVLDTFGDHPATSFEEVTTVRIPVNSVGPSIAPEIWGHLHVSVLGNQPSQIDVRLDGTRAGVEFLGMTRTTRPITESDAVVPVESTEGFPPVGVARVGSELVEFTVLNETELLCQFNATGPMAGFGGRLARHQRVSERDPASIPLGLGAGYVRGAHPAGTLVEHYGYSAVLQSTVAPGQSNLPGEIGPFRVARVMDVGETASFDAIIPAGAFGVNSLRGIEHDNLGPLMLASADDPLNDEDGTIALEGFHPGGGYALLVQGWTGTQFGGGLVTAAPENTPIGGVEVIRYSGKSGNELIIAQRAAHADLGVGFLSQARAFVIDYGGLLTTEGQDAGKVARRGLFCIPISIPVADPNVFIGGGAQANYAQLTHPEAGELTEWVRYNVVQSTYNQLVRIDQPMVEAVELLMGVRDVAQIQSQVPGGGGAPLSGPGLPPPTLPVAVSAPEPGLGQSGGATGNSWNSVRGVADPTVLPMAHAVSDVMRFRGVADTQNQGHATGTLMVPVLRIVAGLNNNMPGAQDPVFLDAGATAGSVVQTNVVHRAYVAPLETQVRTYTHTLVDTPAVAGALDTVPYPNAERGHWVALGAGLSSPIGLSGALPFTEDVRLLPRMAKFPSGERPRTADTVVFGDGARPNSRQASQASPIIIDELQLHTKEHGSGLISQFEPDANQGAGLVLAQDVSDGDTIFQVRTGLFAARGEVLGTRATMGILRGNVGLARVGDEILCYAERDEQTGVITLPIGGRGLLGTTPSPHCAGTVLYPLPEIAATVLIEDVDADGHHFTVLSTSGFPEEGTALIGSELIHFTQKEGNVLAMTRGSLEPGMRDGNGIALFRGRFGTEPAAHVAGTPIILFPFRYWDRWQWMSDTPDLGYLGLRVDQASAHFDSVAFETEPVPFPGVRMSALVRGGETIPWDADPESTPGLFLLDRGTDGGSEPIPIGVWGNSLEARFFVQYEAGAFDPVNFSSHAWKYTPRLRNYGVSYDAPHETLRSVER